MAERLKSVGVLIIGHGRHGKDTVCELLAPQFSSISSSLAAVRYFIFDALKEKYGYTNKEDCYNDRAEHRAEWFALIVAYNKENPTRLAEQIFQEYDIYCGMRSRREFESCRAKKLFQQVVWVDASCRLPLEATDSMELHADDATIVLDNNGPESDLLLKVQELSSFLGVNL